MGGNNEFLSAKLPDTTGTSSNHRRSLSVTPSHRSSRSRITLVEHDPDLVAGYAEKAGDTKVVTYRAPEYTWKDHLLGVLCFNVSKGKEVIVEEGFESPKLLQEPEMDRTFSPWILPVYVLSTRRDTDKHQVPKEAKCTIDTGNMQGNIVSRAFVENILEFSKANFCELTTEEKEGGTGVTGHKLIPDGAIYLTWYHKKSTRVFRNMRFLISPNQHCDLIIGARSIMKDNLLTVPNLMADQASIKFDRKKLCYQFEPVEDTRRATLYDFWFESYQTFVEDERQVTEAKREQLHKKLLRLEDKLVQSKQVLEIAVLELQIYDWGYGKNGSSFDEAVKKKNVKENYELLEKAEGWNPDDSRLHKTIGVKYKRS